MKVAALSLAAILLPITAQPHQEPTHANAQTDQATPTLTIVNRGIRPQTLYARFEYPWDVGNRNYGFIQTVWPGQKLVYDAPVGMKIYACDDKYWGNRAPNEELFATIEAGQSVTFTAARFKPS